MKLMPISFFRRAIAPLSITAAVVLSGCATVPADSGNDPRDPIESFNRQVFEFNEVVDRAVLKPVAQAYEFVLPEPVRDCISNIFSNFREPSNAVNNLLQGKPVDAISDVCRLVVNSTIGLPDASIPRAKWGSKNTVKILARRSVAGASVQARIWWCRFWVRAACAMQSASTARNLISTPIFTSTIFACAMQSSARASSISEPSCCKPTI